MKCLLLCVCLAVIVAVHAAPAGDEQQLLKRLLSMLEGKSSQKRYHYMGSPAVNQNEKGTVWVDLQSVVEVVKACPACRMYIVYKCASSECHNKEELLFPDAGYTWSEFKRIFMDIGAGVKIHGLEDGMEYEIWDVVKEGTAIYPGYTNDNHATITIP